MNDENLKNGKQAVFACVTSCPFAENKFSGHHCGATFLQ
jgi:hypothetical protein